MSTTQQQITSIYIPYVFVDESTLRQIFSVYGNISRVDMIPQTGRNNNTFHKAFIHYITWYPFAYNLLDGLVIQDRKGKHVELQEGGRIYKVFINKNPKSEEEKHLEEKVHALTEEVESQAAMIQSLMNEVEFYKNPGAFRLVDNEAVYTGNPHYVYKELVFAEDTPQVNIVPFDYDVETAHGFVASSYM